MSNLQPTCVEYLTRLREQRDSAHATDELSLRAALDDFLRRAAETLARPVRFIGEGKKLVQGQPDFTVAENDLPIGYIEAEAYNINLGQLSGHAKEQNERFTANLDNFLLTNHLEFQRPQGPLPRY